MTIVMGAFEHGEYIAYGYYLVAMTEDMDSFGDPGDIASNEPALVRPV